MFESIMKFFKKLGKTENKETKSKETAKERLHLVLMQDRANVSADFLELMKQEIIEVIKKYIEVDEKEIDVRLTNEVKADGTTGAPSLYANIPIMNIKNEMKKEITAPKVEISKEDKKEVKETEDQKEKADVANKEELEEKNDAEAEENKEEQKNNAKDDVKEESKEEKPEEAKEEPTNDDKSDKKDNNEDNKSGE